VRCDRLAETLPGVVDDPALLDDRARAHVDACLRCQADLVRYRRLRLELAGWRHETIEPPSGLLEDLVLDLDELDLHRSWHPRRRAAYLGGIAAATAAGVGGVIVLAARSRRLAG
jgi:hypothetical protein